MQTGISIAKLHVYHTLLYKLGEKFPTTPSDDGIIIYTSTTLSSTFRSELCPCKYYMQVQMLIIISLTSFITTAELIYKFCL